MTNFFASYPVTGGGGVPTYANLAAFPSAVTAGNGALGIALDTNILYESNGTTWLAIASPGAALSIGTFDSGVASANGAHIDTNALIMQSASPTVPGLVNTGTQTLAGAKTFSSAPTLSSLTASLPLHVDASKIVTSAAIDLASTDVTGILPPSHGGTGTATTFTQGSVVFAGAAGNFSQDNANFFWDSTNHFLGIGTNAPAAPLDVNGTIRSQAGDFTKFLQWNSAGDTGFSWHSTSFFYQYGGVTVFQVGDLSTYTQIMALHSRDLILGVNGSSVTNVSGFRAAAGQTGDILQIQDAGSVVLSTFDINGHLGIAKSSPGSELDVKGTLRLSGSSSGFVGLKGAAAAGSTTYTLPSSDGSSGQFLSTNASGTLSWATGLANPMTTTGDIIYSSDNSGTAARLAIGSSGQVLHGGTTPSYSAVHLTAGADVTGFLPLSNGGTGIAAGTANAAFNALSPMTTAGDIIYGGTSGAGTRLAAGSSTQILHGGTTPSWAAITLTTDVTGILPTTNGGTGQNSSATFPTSGIVVTEAGTETLTNKTISTSSNTITAATSSVSGIVTAVTQNFGGGKSIVATADELQLSATGNSTQTGTVFQVNGGSGDLSSTSAPLALIRRRNSGTMPTLQSYQANGLVVQGDAVSGQVGAITIIGKNDASSRLSFGDDDSSTRAEILFNHAGSPEALRVDIAGTPTIWVDTNGCTSFGSNTNASSVQTLLASTGTNNVVVARIEQTGGTTTGTVLASYNYPGQTVATGRIFERYSDGSGVLGSITASGAGGVVYNVTSDERLKENIKDLSDTTDLLMQLKMHEFTMKKHPDAGPQIGALAQELYKVLPSAVTVGGDDPSEEPWSVDYIRMVPILIRALQQLRTEFDQYKKSHP